MIVCVCRRVSDRDIKQAMHNGADCIDALSVELGVTLQCGRCGDSCQALLEEHARMEHLPVAA